MGEAKIGLLLLVLQLWRICRIQIDEANRVAKDRDPAGDPANDGRREAASRTAS
jgi:hypothetical protein